ncbi:MAG: caspase family protein [Chloroflexota bacterium]
MPFDKGHALIIGVGSHKHHRKDNVPITVDDAKAVAALLTDESRCGYPEDQITLLHDEKATKENILGALDDLANNTKSEDMVFVFFCGHGIIDKVDEQYHLVSYDARIKSKTGIKDTGVSEGEFLAKLNAITAEKVFVVFNTCHASGVTSDSLSVGEDDELETGTPSNDTTAAILGTGEGRIVITACREAQKSWLVPEDKDLTFFGKALVSGLKGEGAVVDKKGFISAFNLYEHVYESVKDEAKQRKGQDQEPGITVVNGFGPFPVSLYRGNQDSLSLGAFEDDTELMDSMAPKQLSKEDCVKIFEQRVEGSIMNNVQAGGDVVGRDKTDNSKTMTANDGGVVGETVTINGDVTRGDKTVVHGNQVNIPAINGDFIGGTIAGGNIRTETNYYNTQDESSEPTPQKILMKAVAKWKDDVGEYLSQSSDMIQPKKDDINGQLEKIEAEVKKRDKVNAGNIDYYLTEFCSKAPELVDTTFSTLQQPFADVGIILTQNTGRISATKA